jgi:multiple sugar transport system ATP-binding protein
VRIDADGPLRGRVVHTEYFGSHWIADVETAAGTLKAYCEKRAAPALGEPVGLSVRRQRVVLFDADTKRLLPSATTIEHTTGMRDG